jgi:hypothetical protein
MSHGSGNLSELIASRNIDSVCGRDRGNACPRNVDGEGEILVFALVSRVSLACFQCQRCLSERHVYDRLRAFWNKRGGQTLSGWTLRTRHVRRPGISTLRMREYALPRYFTEALAVIPGPSACVRRVAATPAPTPER